MRRLTDPIVTALREHLETRQRPRIPEGSLILWNAFIALDGTRTWHQFGPNPISHQEIAAWCALYRTPLEPHHVEVIRSMDGAFLEHWHARNGKSDRAVAGRLTPKMFDAAMG